MSLIKKININNIEYNLGVDVIDNLTTEDSDKALSSLQGKLLYDMITNLNKKVFPLSISVSGGSVCKKGTTQSITVKWTVKEGDNVVTPDSITINGEAITNTLTNKTYTGVTETTTYTVEVIKNGISKSSSTTITFVNPAYYGVVASNFEATSENIKGLTELVKSTKGTTQTFTITDQKICYAYPKSQGALTSIKDGNGFEYLKSYTRSELTINDETYYVYVLTDPATQTGLLQKYA